MIFGTGLKMTQPITLPQDQPDSGVEEILEPELAICDSHHHLWDLPEGGSEFLARMHIKRRRFLLPEMLGNIQQGHDIVSTVFVDAGAFYRSDGSPELRPLGETEFVNGTAAMSASGRYGSSRVCAGIVGGADLTIGVCVEELLGAHVAAGGGRFRGVRQSATFDSTGAIPPNPFAPPPHLYLKPEFRQGFAVLRRFGLSFDAWLYHPQIPELIDLALAFPDQPIVLDHMGTPLGVGPYAGRRDEVFDVWRASICALARCPNVSVKLGGLGMVICGFEFEDREVPASSSELALAWKPYIETCIGAFGTERCMFESNFPVDEASTSYRTMWNAFKRITNACSAEDKRRMYHDVAQRIYRLKPAS
jgi:L-fuconolactonase